MTNAKFRLLLSLIALLFAGAIDAQAQLLITFDPLTNQYEQIPAGYDGMTWSSNFYAVAPGYWNGAGGGSNPGFNVDLISSPDIGTNYFGPTAATFTPAVSGSTFTLNSAYFADGSSSGNAAAKMLTVEALDASNTLIPGDTTTFSIDQTSAVFETFNWTGVTTVQISGAAFSVDNIQINAVPEPSTYALGLLGLGILALTTRRRAAKPVAGGVAR